MIDPLNIFSEIKREVLKKFPGSRVFAGGSRSGLGWKKINENSKLDFDVYVFNTDFNMEPSLKHLEILNISREIVNFFQENKLDEFGRPVRVDIFLIKSNGEGANGIEI